MGAKSDGTVTGVQGAAWSADLGAYFQILTPFIPELGFPVAGGCYDVPTRSTCTSPACSRTSSRPTRSAAPGRPEMTHWVEVMMDRLALELDIGPGRDPAQELHPRGRVPVRDAARDRLRLGQLRGHARQDARECSTSTAFRARAGGAARARASTAGVGFSTYTEVCGLAPSRAVGPQGVGLQAAFWESATVRVHPTRLGDRLLRRLAARPGARHELRADRRGPARDRPAERRGAPRRHQPGPVRLGHLRLALAVASAARRSPAPPSGCRTKAKTDLRRDARGRARGHRARRRRVPGEGPAGQDDVDGRHRRRGAHPAAGAADRDRAGARGDRRSTTRRTSSSRSAPTRASSTSTSRPARSRSCAGSRSTTAGRRSTRC